MEADKLEWQDTEQLDHLRRQHAQKHPQPNLLLVMSIMSQAKRMRVKLISLKVCGADTIAKTVLANMQRTNVKQRQKRIDTHHCITKFETTVV